MHGELVIALVGGTAAIALMVAVMLLIEKYKP